MSDEVLHVAIADDWEMSRGFGEYEVATRGVPLAATGFVHATTREGVSEVVRHRYADLTLPLLVVELSVPALADAGVTVEWHNGSPRIMGPVPMTPEVVLSETPLNDWVNNNPT